MTSTTAKILERYVEKYSAFLDSDFAKGASLVQFHLHKHGRPFKGIVPMGPVPDEIFDELIAKLRDKYDVGVSSDKLWIDVTKKNYFGARE